MLRRELEPRRPRPLLYAVAIGVLSVLAAVLVASAFAQAFGCSRSAKQCATPPRPAKHCPDLQLLVYRDCAWRCE